MIHLYITRSGSVMDNVDSAGYLKDFSDEPNADFFAPAIENMWN
jgi:hypothetical protein